MKFYLKEVIMNAKSDEIVSFNLGKQPINNRFLKNKSDTSPSFKVEIIFDQKNNILKLASPFPVDQIKPQYNWITCYEPEAHLDDLIKIIVSLKEIDHNTVFSGFSFKDDTCLRRLNDKGYKNTWRIDPKLDLGIKDELANIETFQEKFTNEKANQIVNKRKKADVLFVRHVIEHAYDIDEFVLSLKKLIKDDGLIVFEIPDCLESLQNGNCSMVWEEHIYYFTEETFFNFLKKKGFEIIFSKSWYYSMENSIVAIVKKARSNDVEFNQNLYNRNVELLKNYKSKILVQKKIIKNKLSLFREQHGSIAMFGAGHLTITFISIYELKSLIDFVFDDNPNKENMFLPCGGIPIYSSNKLLQTDTKLCLLCLNPDHHEKISDKLAKLSDNNLIIGSIFPESKNYVEKIL